MADPDDTDPFDPVKRVFNKLVKPQGAGWCKWYTISPDYRTTMSNELLSLSKGQQGKLVEKLNNAKCGLYLKLVLQVAIAGVGATLLLVLLPIIGPKVEEVDHLNGSTKTNSGMLVLSFITFFVGCFLMFGGTVASLITLRQRLAFTFALGQLQHHQDGAAAARSQQYRTFDEDPEARSDAQQARDRCCCG